MGGGEAGRSGTSEAGGGVLSSKDSGKLWRISNGQTIVLTFLKEHLTAGEERIRWWPGLQGVFGLSCLFFFSQTNYIGVERYLGFL